jgi:hypothetical protein
MVVVGMHLGSMLRVLLVVLLLVMVGVEERRHDGWSREYPAPEESGEKRWEWKIEKEERRNKESKFGEKVGSWEIWYERECGKSKWKKRKRRRAFELERRSWTVGGRRGKKEGCFGAERVRYGHVW